MMGLVATLRQYDNGIPVNFLCKDISTNVVDNMTGYTGILKYNVNDGPWVQRNLNNVDPTNAQGKGQFQYIFTSVDLAVPGKMILIVQVFNGDGLEISNTPLPGMSESFINIIKGPTP